LKAYQDRNFLKFELHLWNLVLLSSLINKFLQQIPEARLNGTGRDNINIETHFSNHAINPEGVTLEYKMPSIIKFKQIFSIKRYIKIR
jgi:hypothetical protein